MNGKFIIYALLVTALSTCSNWGRMAMMAGTTGGSSGGSSWSSSTGSSGGSWSSSGGGHK